MTTSSKFSLHSQGEHPFPAELLLSTNQGGQLLALTLLLEALTICVGGGVIHGTSNCGLLFLKWHSCYRKELNIVLSYKGLPMIVTLSYCVQCENIVFQTR